MTPSRLLRLSFVARVLLGLLALGLLLPGVVQATIFWVNPATGSNSNAGTSKATAWKDLKRARTAGTCGSNVCAGDTVTIVNGTYTLSQYQAAGDWPIWREFDAKGSAGSPIIIQAETPGGVTFNGERGGLWVSFYPASTTSYYIVVKDLTFTNYAGSVINIGNSSDSFAVGAVQARYVAVVGCYFHDLYQAGAATTGTINSDHVIFKDNVQIHLGDPAFGYPASGDHAYYISHHSQYVVIDHNYSEKVAGFAHHIWGDFTPTTTWVTDHVIVRRNTSVNAKHGGTIVAGGVTYSNIYVYNNTYFTEAHSYPEIEGQGTSPGIATSSTISFHNGSRGWSNVHVKNNLSDSYIDDGNGGGFGVLASDAGASFPSLELDYNLWLYRGGGGTLYYWLANSYTTLAAFQAATVYGDHDVVADPQLSDPTAGHRDFTLKSAPLSPAIDAGTFLTTATNSAGSNSVTLTVGDAGYFHDGFGMIAGDTIRIGANTAVISSINYSTNTITLVAPGTVWSSGNGVALAYNGSAPDMGANESGTAIVGGATQLKFVQQPQTTDANAILPPLTVEVRDGSNVLVPTATNPVTLFLNVAPGIFVSQLATQTQMFTTPKTGRYVKLVSLTDIAAGTYTSAAEINFLAQGQVIPQAGISVVSVSTGGQNTGNEVTKALDGNTGTYWYSQFSPTSTPHPHTVVFDLGASYSVNGWTYLPFQDADTRGRIATYELYVSTDGTTWGTAMTDAQLTGVLTANAVAGVATFSTLEFGHAQSGYRLAAFSSGLTQDLSQLFDITVASVYTALEAPILFADAAQTPNVTFTLANLAANQGQYSSRLNLGTASYAALFRWRCTVQLTGANTAGQLMEVWMGTSDGVNADGQLGTGGGALASAQRLNLLYLGPLSVDQPTTNTAMTGSGTFFTPAQYLHLGLWNATAINLNNSTGVHSCVVTPYAWENEK